MRSNYKRLGEYIRQVDIRNKDLKLSRLLGVSISKSFIESIANTVGTDFSNYKVVRKRQFAYGPVTSRNGEKISVALLEEDACIISSSYIVFEIVDVEKLLPEYLMLWFSRPEFDRYARHKSHGSVREIFDWNELCDTYLPVPTIDEQKNIVMAYKSVEDRIKLKRKINDNLVKQVATLYTELIRNNEANAILSDIANICSGKRPLNTESGEFPLVGAGAIMDYISDYNFDEPILITGRVGTHGVIQRFSDKCWASDNTLVIKSQHYEFVYQFLRKVDYSLLNKGSTQPLITQTDLNNLPLYIPESANLLEFENVANIVMEHYEIQNHEIVRLKCLCQTIINSLSSSA